MKSKEQRIEELAWILHELRCKHTLSKDIAEELIENEGYAKKEDHFLDEEFIRLRIANDVDLDNKFFMYQEGKMTKRRLCREIAKVISSCGGEL